MYERKNMISFKLNDYEFEILKKCCDKEKIAKSEMIRKTLREWAKHNIEIKGNVQ